MSDVFNVTAAYDKSSYNAGDTIKATISGTNAHTSPDTVTHQTSGAVAIPLVSSPSGATSVLNLAGVDVVTTVPGGTTNESVLIDNSAFQANQGGRTWAVSADRKSITTVA